MQYPYLISRVIDPIFGIGMGVASYYLYEKRHGREEGHYLNQLIAQKFRGSK
ncbi:uncharacterized protein CANTADRAFT_45301 [Suhomyces tanzawaensis NRRL Y-17324]|uniref:Non-classical export protein 1 n=1 Tax=Suhomyces tanzawaensis NRRL Y-17324 TaxID=984487 RepID=A0A1E4SQ51_9ASCO|nr:uncharacterized protein CANTADRAFT_45301 [Suhomyces tanzawaensis NRRL Y-17324]ODV81629.1 hypothetical protein CANTADRAFT_45301 [Suhomyces tanzawaensis NRRL Y-17324]